MEGIDLDKIKKTNYDERYENTPFTDDQISQKIHDKELEKDEIKKMDLLKEKHNTPNQIEIGFK